MQNFKTYQSDKVLQKRFAFSTRREYVRLFEIMESFRNCTIVFDEADALFTIRDFETPLINVFLGSRNNNVTLIYVGKRPFLIPIFVRSQVDEYIIFCTEEKRDIDYLSNRLRATFPKDPFKLQQGEAIIFRSGKPPILEKFRKFTVKGKKEPDVKIETHVESDEGEESENELQTSSS